MVLRRATVGDLPEVVALERVCYGDPWPVTAFAALPDNPQVFFATAREEEGGPVKGYVVAWYVMDEGELANLAVTPPARGRGIGGVLLDAMLDDARARGTSQVFLEVRGGNEAALRLYRSRGFDDVGRRKGYYRMPVEDALILRREVKR